MKKIKVIVESSGYPGDIYRNETFFIKMTDAQFAQVELAMEITGENLSEFMCGALRYGLLNG